jgi:hypothetical protein
MQMEDDVLTIPGYLNVIKQFIAEQKVEWSCLEFSQIGLCFEWNTFPINPI